LKHCDQEEKCVLVFKRPVITQAVEIPVKYCCPISQIIMYDPVITSDGHTYERECIMEWLKTHNTSPKTGLVLPNKTLTHNHDKRSDIAEFLQHHPELDEQEVYLPQAVKADFAAAIRGHRWDAMKRLIAREQRLLHVVLESDYCALHLVGTEGSPELAQQFLGLLGSNLAVIDEATFDAQRMVCL
jgi:hypothetical protein